jgi:uncharacterized protein DUF4253
MSPFRLIMTLFLLLFAATHAVAVDCPPALTAYEERLADQVGMDKDVLLAVREEARNDLHRLVGYDEEGYQILAPGVVVSVSRSRTETVLRALREKLRHRKYMAFVIEYNDAIKHDKIGIIRGTDQYAILQIMNTNGETNDVGNAEIVERLKVWEKKNPFEIIGAENDWVEIEFRNVPPDLKALAEEVSDFCPDAVDEGAGSVGDLIKHVTATKRLLLFWD